VRSPATSAAAVRIPRNANQSNDQYITQTGAQAEWKAVTQSGAFLQMSVLWRLWFQLRPAKVLPSRARKNGQHGVRQISDDRLSSRVMEGFGLPSRPWFLTWRSGKIQVGQHVAQTSPDAENDQRHVRDTGDYTVTLGPSSVSDRRPRSLCRLTIELIQSLSFAWGCTETGVRKPIRLNPGAGSACNRSTLLVISQDT